jgi:hypothetical protein
MALFRQSEKRNYKLEPDRFRQGRIAGFYRQFPVPVLSRLKRDFYRFNFGAPVKFFHCTQVSQT